MAFDYLAYIQKGSLARGLDPAAVAAVASVEGGFGGPSSAPGDGGTSFGPFQLHIGGALPKAVAARGPQYAQQWAWSKQGINYALDRIRSVAANKGGAASVQAIVSGFEKPRDVPGEIQRALGRYSQFQGGSATPGDVSMGGGELIPGSGNLGEATGSPEALLEKVPGVGDFLKVGEFLGRLTDPSYILRGLQIIAGGAMVFAGLVLLVRQIGLAPSSFSSGNAPGVSKRDFDSLQADVNELTKPAVEEDLRPKPVYSTRARKPRSSVGQTEEIPF